ncbi:hypothetical protein BGX26_003928, partial [Mortierella sp. AD094]
MSTAEIATAAVLVVELYLFILDNLHLPQRNRGYEEDDDNEDEYFRLRLNNLPRLPNDRLDLDRLSPKDSRKNFRFTVNQIDEISRLMFIPDVIKTPERDAVDRREALAI